MNSECTHTMVITKMLWVKHFCAGMCGRECVVNNEVTYSSMKLFSPVVLKSGYEQE